MYDQIVLFWQDPPNFLRASDLHSHVKPVAVVPEPECLEAETPDADSFTDSLIDTSSVCSVSYYIVLPFSKNDQRT